MKFVKCKRFMASGVLDNIAFIRYEDCILRFPAIAKYAQVYNKYTGEYMGRYAGIVENCLEALACTPEDFEYTETEPSSV